MSGNRRVCGIIAIVCGKRRSDLGKLLTEALKRLEYRGYDSVGIAVIDGGRLYVAKNVGDVDTVARSESFDAYSGSTGIGHTRWATHGAPSRENAHPHTDCGGRIAVAHNGIIENYLELKAYLESRGHKFVSETDTEVVPHLIEEFKSQGLDTYTAFKKAVSLLRGTFAIVAIDVAEPRRVFFARMVSPLVVGLGDDEMLVSSDIVTLLPLTRRVIVINDKELGYVEPDRVLVETLSGELVDVRSRLTLVEYELEEIEKGGYRHYMIKEIHEQPYSLAQTISGLLSSTSEVERAVKLLRDSRMIYVIGAGSSYHASLLGALYFNYLGLRALAVVSSEAPLYLGAIRPGDAVVAVSQSGETIDTLAAVREAARRGANVVAIVNNPLSTIAREAETYIYMRAGPEICVAATKTFTSQVATLLYLGAMLKGLNPSRVRESLRRIPEVAFGVIKSAEEVAISIAKKISDKSSAYYLGRAFGYPLSAEAALKIKEVAYIHAEAYPAGESKHGPISLVTKGFPVMFTVVGELDQAIEGNIEEMKARGAYVVTVIPRSKVTPVVGKNSDVIIPMPDVPLEVSLTTYVIPYQLLAYYTAIERGLDPDKPRNLAKTVTVF